MTIQAGFDSYGSNAKSEGVEVDRGPSIEELGQSYAEITSQITELLERREHIRKQFEQKMQMARDMSNAISQKFNERTGINAMMPVDESMERARF